MRAMLSCHARSRRLHARASLIPAGSAQQTVNFFRRRLRAARRLWPRRRRRALPGLVDFLAVRHPRLQGRRRSAANIWSASAIASMPGSASVSTRTAAEPSTPISSTPTAPKSIRTEAARRADDGDLPYLPLGHHDAIEPYIGAGVGDSEVALHRDRAISSTTDSNSSSAARFNGSGTDVGPVILGGVRVPLGAASTSAARFAISAAKGTLPTTRDFAGSTDRSRRLQLSVHRRRSIPREGLTDDHSVLTLVERDARTFAHRVNPSRNSDARARSVASMSPPSAFSSIRIQPAYGRGPSAPTARCRRCLRAGNRARRTRRATSPACSGRAIPCSP